MWYTQGILDFRPNFVIITFTVQDNSTMLLRPEVDSSRDEDTGHGVNVHLVAVISWPEIDEHTPLRGRSMLSLQTDYTIRLIINIWLDVFGWWHRRMLSLQTNYRPQLIINIWLDVFWWWHRRMLSLQSDHRIQLIINIWLDVFGWYRRRMLNLQTDYMIQLIINIWLDMFG